MPPREPTGNGWNRRTFLKTTGAVTAGAALYPYLGCVPQGGRLGGAAAAAEAGWSVRPFALTDVRLGDGLFREKRDRMLNYARNYGSATDVHAGPDRLLSIFRANAGLDTRGAQPVGSWENASGYLRGHYAGHFLSMLAQSYASTGDPVYREKLDYMVAALGECRDALAAAAARPTPRVAGRHGTALRLTGSPLGHAEHVRLPANLVDGLQDFTIAVWVRPYTYDRDGLPYPEPGPEGLLSRAAVFSFGSPNPEYAGEPLAHMYLTVRESDERPGPRFAITTTGVTGEQALEAPAALPVGEWTHLAVTRSGNTGTLYVNGRPVARNDALTLAPAELGATSDNWLGRHQFPQRSVPHLNGELDEFRVYGRALDEAEVASLLEAASDGAAGGAGGGDVAWYRFDEAEGPTVVDSSGRGRDGTVVGPTDGGRHPGFLSAYPETQFIRLEEFAEYTRGNDGIWAPYYTLHKILAGLLDAHVHTGNAQALELALGIGDWVHSRVAQLRPEQLDRMWDLFIAGEFGGVNESLAYLHAFRPERRYLEAAERFVNANVFDPTLANVDRLDGRHANTHIPQFLGYLRGYERGESADLYTATRNFWDMVVPYRIYSHGGMGVGEIFRERGMIAHSLWGAQHAVSPTGHDRDHAETCCVYNMLKLSRNLFFHEPDPKYMNYYELGLFNQIAGSRRDADSTNSPEVTYFIPVQPGQRRRYGNTGTCCGGTGLENHTKYQDSIYFRSVDNQRLYVNLYIPSVLEWPEKGFTVTQETRYPAEGASTLTVNGSGPLDIALRVPAWVRKGFTVRVNGEAQALDATPGTYVTLSRRWNDGDRVEIAMPFSFRTERALDEPSVQSIYYGPNLLVVEREPVGEGLEAGLLDVSFYRHVKLDGDLAPAMAPGDRPLHFRTHGLSLAPIHVADPVAAGASPEATQPYHVYVRRLEPAIVFGSVDSGVPNRPGTEGLTFLDRVWDQAPFPDHARFVATVEQVAANTVAAGALTAAEAAGVVEAARRAEADLRV
jgi:uncharacterized protein